MANPNKTQPIVDILTGNRDKLLKYLTDFHSDKGEFDYWLDRAWLRKNSQQLACCRG